MCLKSCCDSNHTVVPPWVYAGLNWFFLALLPSSFERSAIVEVYSILFPFMWITVLLFSFPNVLCLCPAPSPPSLCTALKPCWWKCTIMYVNNCHLLARLYIVLIKAISSASLTESLVLYYSQMDWISFQQVIVEDFYWKSQNLLCPLTWRWYELFLLPPCWLRIYRREHYNLKASQATFHSEIQYTLGLWRPSTSKKQSTVFGNSKIISWHTVYGISVMNDLIRDVYT